MWNFIKLSFILGLTYLVRTILKKPCDRSQLDPINLCPTFEVSYGNFSTARIFLLGEFHDRRNETIQCIERLFKDENHVVYLEGVPFNEERECETVYFGDAERLVNFENRICKGWDEMSLNNKSQEVMHKLEITQYSDPYFRNEFKNLQFLRNMNMLKIITNHDPNLLAVIIAGLGHLVAQDDYDLGASWYMQRKLEGGAGQNPYVVLGMRG